MRLICPNCRAQYEVPDHVIPEGGRDVQCSSCDQTWFQTPAGPAEPPSAPDREPDPGPDAGPDTAETPETDAEPTAMAPVEIADKPDEDGPRPAGPVHREIDPAVLEILREEAAHEARMRASDSSGIATGHADDASTPEATPDTIDLSQEDADPIVERTAGFEAGLDEDEPEESTPWQIPDEDALAAIDEDEEEDDWVAADDAEIHAETELDPGTEPETPSDSQPDSEDAVVAATLAAEEDVSATTEADETPHDTKKPKTDDSDDEDMDAPVDILAAVPRETGRSGFILGFALVVLIGIGAVMTYTKAATIAAVVPEAEPTLTAYVVAIDQGRVWLNDQVTALLLE